MSENQSSTTNQYIAGLSATLGAFAAGTVLGWSAPVQAEVEGGKLGFPVDKDAFSWIGSLVTFGCAFVCIPTGFLITIFGRKLTMLLLVIPFSIGWALLIFAKNAVMMMVARFILGLSGGAFCVAAPMYTTEIAQNEIRGILGSFFQLLLVNGVLFSYVVGAYVKCVTLSVICSILPIIFGIIFIFMPESPVYLVSKGKIEAATNSLQWLRGKNYDPTAEMNEIRAADAKLKENPTPLGKALCRRVTLKGLGLAFSLMAFQQLGGINAVIFYSTSLFKDANTGISGEMCTILVGSMMVLATFAALPIIDKLGRRPLLLASAFFDGLSTAAIGVFFYMKDKDENSVKSLNWLPIASIVVFIIMFSIGMGPVPWLFMAEVFTTDVKGIAGSIAGTTNWMMAFLITKMFVVMQSAMGTGPSFWIFAFISFFATVFMFLFIPETKGKSFTEIQEELEK